MDIIFPHAVRRFELGAGRFKRTVLRTWTPTPRQAMHQIHGRLEEAVAHLLEHRHRMSIAVDKDEVFFADQRRR